MPQEQKIHPSGVCFKQDWHGTYLDICPSSCNSMLPSSWIVRLDSSLNLMDFSALTKSSMVELVRDPVRNLSTTFWIWLTLSSYSRITSCAIPSILRSTLNSGSSFSTSDAALRICVQMLSGFGCLLEYRVPLFAQVSWCPKQLSPMCLAAAAVAAAVIARHSWVLSSVLDEASRVFRIKFFLKSLYRCNLPAQGCIQLRHGICFARNVVLCLARAKWVQ